MYHDHDVFACPRSDITKYKLPRTQLSGGQLNETAAMRATEAGGMTYRKQLGEIMESKAVRCYFVSIVLVNALLIGIRMDYGGDNDTWDALEHGFLSIFFIEVALRITAFSWGFFTDPWNCIDFVVVAIGIVELGILIVAGSPGNSAFTAIRLVRIFRIIRLFGFFDRLSKLVEAFIGAMKDVVWVAMLVVVIVYIFAILTCSFYGNNKELDDAGFDSGKFFGTVPKSMATLFQIMTLDGWMSEIVHPVGDVYPFAWFVLLLWCCIGALGLLNLMTAIFIDSLTALSCKESKKQAVKIHTKRSTALKMVKQLFLDFDVNNDCTLDNEEMEKVLAEMANNQEITQTFHECGITNVQIEEAMGIADADGDGVQYEEFVHALDVMDDKAQKKDTMRLTKQIATLEAEVRGLKEQVQSLVNVIHASNQF